MSQLLLLTEEILSSTPEISAVVASFKKGYIDDVLTLFSSLTVRRRVFRLLLKIVQNSWIFSTF